MGQYKLEYQIFKKFLNFTKLFLTLQNHISYKLTLIDP